MKTRVETRFLIAFDGAEHVVVPNGVLVYNEDTIEYAGEFYRGSADEVVDARDKLVAPGFVCIHSHLALSPFLKSVHEDVANRKLGMSSLYDVVLPIASAVAPATAEIAVSCSLLELLRSGTTTVVDLTFLPDVTASVTRNVGIRTYVSPMFQSARCRVEEGRRVVYDWGSREDELSALAEACEFVRRTERVNDPLLRTMLSPTTVDTCSPELLRDAHEAARDLGVRLQIHTAESIVGYAEIVSRHGHTPVAHLDSLGLLTRDTILAHCIFCGRHSWVPYGDDDDFERISRAGTSVAHCPHVQPVRNCARIGQVLSRTVDHRRARHGYGSAVDALRDALRRARSETRRTHRRCGYRA